jgi:hypothetical protein
VASGSLWRCLRLEHGPCAVAALEAWLTIREQKKGPLFVSFSPHGELRETRIDGRLVAEVVKRLFRDAGASPRDVDAIGAHSLRRGFVTSADMAGATTAQIMDVTGIGIRSRCDATPGASCCTIPFFPNSSDRFTRRRWFRPSRIFRKWSSRESSGDVFLPVRAGIYFHVLKITLQENLSD